MTHRACVPALPAIEAAFDTEGGLMADADRRSALVELAAYGQELRIESAVAVFGSGYLALHQNFSFKAN